MWLIYGCQKIPKPENTPIEKFVFDGQTILVQVLKDPLGTKGARLSTHISIAGRNLVYLPQEDNGNQIAISQKIESLEQRDALKNVFKHSFRNQLKAVIF